MSEASIALYGILGTIAVIQSYSLYRIFNDNNHEYLRNKSFERRFNEIIPLIEKYPNPRLAIFFYEMGADLENIDDAQLKLAGYCLKNMDVVLREEVDDNIKYSEKYIKQLQDAVRLFGNSVVNNNKKTLIDAMNRFFYLLYKYDHDEVILSTKEEMVDLLNLYIHHFDELEVDDNLMVNIGEMQFDFDVNNDNWSYEKLKQLDTNMIILYSCFNNVLRDFHSSEFKPDLNKERVKIAFFNNKMKRCIKYVIKGETYNNYYALSELYRTVIGR